MSQYINKSHNVTALLYHLVFPAKYRRVVFDDDVEKVLKEVCLGIEERYEIKFGSLCVPGSYVRRTESRERSSDQKPSIVLT